MFELGKVIGWLLSPLALALACLGSALLLYSLRRPLAGLLVGLLGFAGLWIVSTPLVAHALAHQLEARFPALLAEQSPKADAIVVLGGALSGASPPERPVFDLNSAADRVWHAAALFRAGKARWVLVSGGNQPDTAGLQVEAEAIRDMLLTLGVPDSAIRLEGVSRNTAENARESVKLLQEIGARRVLLVTSAMHMPRALRIFQAELRAFGVTVLPASTDVEGLPDTLHPLGRWLPDANALALSSRAVKEYLGLAQVQVTRSSDKVQGARGKLNGAHGAPYGPAGNLGYSGLNQIQVTRFNGSRAWAWISFYVDDFSGYGGVQSSGYRGACAG